LSGIVALDRDYDGGVSEILDALIPPSPVRKVGSKGYTAFYRYAGEITRRWSVGGERVLELLSDGTQTVLPPSIHPGTRKPYYWETVDDLLSLDLDELPVLPSDFCEQVTRALEPYTGTTVAGSGKPTGAETVAEQVTERQLAEIREALGHIPADDRDIWIRVGMALKTIGEAGFELWVEWSRTSSKYDEAAHRSMVSRWRGFKVLEGGVSYRTIFSLAIENGYTPTVALDSEPLIRPGLVGNMARAALEFAQRNGQLVELDADPAPADADPEPRRRIRTGLKLLSGDEIGDLTPPDWLIKGVQVCDSLAMTYGAAGAGKSFHALDKALHIAAGVAFHGRKVKQGPVVYVAGEGRAGVAKRVRAWCQHYGLNLNDLPFYVTSRAVAFLDGLAVLELSELLHNLETNPVYISIDTLNRNFGDGDENSTRDMSAFVSALDGIRVLTGACVEVIHHSGKGEQRTARGNSALRAALDTEVSVVPRDGGGIRVTCTKQKDAEPFGSLDFDLQKIDLGEIDGERIESLVPVQNVEAEAMRDSLSSILENDASKAAQGRRQILQAIRGLVNVSRHNRPELGQVVIERIDLHEKLEAHAVGSKSARNRAIGWAVELGVLHSDGPVMYVDESLLEAAENA
ncbi:MAG TPA: AAA family ATPase, partial [Acidimicrobiia bacterium]